MATTEPKKIKIQVSPKHVTAIVAGKKYVVEADATAKKAIKELVEKYNLKNTEATLKKILIALTPKEEKKKQELLVKKKVVHKKVKEAKKQLKAAVVAEKEAVKEIALEYTYSPEEEKYLKKVKELVLKDGQVYLKGAMSVRMPRTLISRFVDFVKVNTSTTPLLNFWKLALLNPNPIARTKLFDYLTQQNLTVTPNGYFVTYRMVKKTGNKTAEGKDIFTSNYAGKEEYIIGQAYSIPRTECDEDGSRDCSKGLHTGTPRFIGIVADNKVEYKEGEQTVGDGYGIKVTTKAATSDSYGTGYDSPHVQKFDHTFGNQAVICLVNPMHVVSIPDSSTRKMRSCELYFCKTTTAEEVVKMVESDYLVFDNEYYQYEMEEIEKMLKTTQLKDFIDNAKAKRAAKAKELAEIALDKAMSQLHVGKDNVSNKDLSPEELYNLIRQRTIKVKQVE